MCPQGLSHSSGTDDGLMLTETNSLKGVNMTTLEKLEQIHFCILENIERHDNGIHADAELLAQALMLVEDVREEHFNTEEV